MKHRVGALVGPGRREDVGVDVPLGLRADPAARRRPARLPEAVHDLRPGRRQPPHRLRDPRPRPRPEAVPAALGARHRSARPRTTASAPTQYAERGPGHLRAQDRRHLPRVPGPPPAGRGHGLRRPARQDRRAAPDATPTCSSTTSAASSTSWSTSTRTPTSSRTSSSCSSAKEHRNVCVVGDGDQCLPTGTMVSTPTGPKPIEQIQVGDEVHGHRRPLRRRSPGRVTPGRRRASGPAGSTSCGPAAARLQGTPHHIVFADTMLDHDQWIVYLMHRARPWLAHRADEDACGPTERALDSRARGCGSTRSTPTSSGSCRSATREPTPSYWEAFFAAEYGLPTALLPRHRAEARRWARSGSSGSTTCSTPRSRAKELMEDLDLHPEFPHMRPDGGASPADAQPDDVRRRARAAAGVGHHRVQWCSNRPDDRRAAARRRASRCGRASGEPSASRRIAQGLRRRGRARHAARPTPVASTIRRRAQIGDRVWDFVPLSHLRPGMTRARRRRRRGARPDAGRRGRHRRLRRTGLRPRGRRHAHLSSPTTSACTTASTSSGVRT